ncbi:MAG: lytic murein transglycosylase, partial [Stellaceae bacterium]
MRFVVLMVFLCGLSGTAFAQDQGFGDWLGKFRAEALRAGISSATFDVAMADVQPIPRIIDLDQAQPETKLQFSDYVRRLSSQQRRAGVQQH